MNQAPVAMDRPDAFRGKNRRACYSPSIMSSNTLLPADAEPPLPLEISRASCLQSDFFVDTIFIALQTKNREKNHNKRDRGPPIGIYANRSSSMHGNARLGTARVAETELVPLGGIAKRAFDVLIASLALASILPLFALAALLVKCTSCGPVFFRHERIGFRGERFFCYKFRTMVIDADASLDRLLAQDESARAQWQVCQKLTHDPRVTKTGQYLRMSSIDELPQLINVLRGEMSIVGPRPIVQAEIARYRDKFGDYVRARPGITGLWQVSGRSDTSFEFRTELDRRYVRNWKFSRDLLILLKTIPVVLSSKGSY
jgi:exopolysaccharide production protein ExoY